MGAVTHAKWQEKSGWTYSKLKFMKDWLRTILDFAASQNRKHLHLGQEQYHSRVHKSAHKHSKNGNGHDSIWDAHHVQPQELLLLWTQH